MDCYGDGGGGLTATGLFCGSCGAQSSAMAKFCGECGTSVAHAARSAEYKQVTVLFADVVHSMDIAAAVGAERLREIMADLVNITTAVVKRYGGTVDKFTGDGIMAVFGAPVALEDHAMRACLAALGIQEQARGCGSGPGSRRRRAATSGRPELRSSDRWQSRLDFLGLHHYWRAGGNGSADGVGRSAGCGDAQRVNSATG